MTSAGGGRDRSESFEGLSESMLEELLEEQLRMVGASQREA